LLGIGRAVYGIKMTHKVAGPLFKITLYLNKMRDGRLDKVWGQLAYDAPWQSRQQHDEAEKNSEKSRLAKDVQRHHHPVDEQVDDSGSAHDAKRKN